MVLGKRKYAASSMYRSVAKRPYTGKGYQGWRYPRKYRGLNRFRSGQAALGRELKFFDTAISFNMDATAEIPTTGQLCIIPQDDTQSGRDGRKVVVKSITGHGSMFFAPGAAATAADIAFMYLVQDTQCNGAAATVSDANTGIFNSANLVLALRTLANAERFKILKKWVVPMQPQAGVTTAYNNSIRPWVLNLKCDIPIEYDASATTGALTTIRSNNLFLVAGTAGNSDDLIAVAGTIRLRYYG